MGCDIAFNTPLGSIGGWRADPVEVPRGAVVVVHEIYGANAHIRSVADRYAAEGYVAIAPAFFDPVERGVELGYDKPATAKGLELVAALGIDRAVTIVAGAAKLLQDEGLKIGVVGFCWGGTVALLANTRLALPAVSYYGARNTAFLDEPLRAPMLFHFGERDPSIPASAVAAHREKYPQAGIHMYPAGHAFNREIDSRAYEADSAQLAHRRTLQFFADALG